MKLNNNRLLIFLVGGLSGLTILLFLVEAAQYIAFPGFPYEGPWQGIQVIAAARVLEGLPLYPDPLFEPSYYIYSPVLAWIHAGFILVLGKSILTMKLSALFFCFANVSGVFVVSRLLGASRLAATIGVAYYLSFFTLLHFWHLSVRPDNPGTAIILWGVASALLALKFGKTRFMLAAGLLFALAALCKQPFVLIGIAFVFYLYKKNERSFLLLFLPVWIVTGSVVTLFYSFADEHFLQSMLIFARHDIYSPVETITASRFIFIALAVPLAISFLQRTNLGLVGALIVAAFFVGFVGMSKWGGNYNVFLPLVALTATVISFQLSREAKEPMTTSLVCISTAFLLIVFCAESFKRVLNYEETRSGNITSQVAFIEANKDKQLYYPINNYLTWIYADQYHHCDWMSENLVKARYRPPRAFLASLVNREYDIILGEFNTSGLNDFRTHFYDLSDAYPEVGVRIYTPKAEL